MVAQGPESLTQASWKTRANGGRPRDLVSRERFAHMQPPPLCTLTEPKASADVDTPSKRPTSGFTLTAGPAAGLERPTSTSSRSDGQHLPRLTSPPWHRAPEACPKPQLTLSRPKAQLGHRVCSDLRRSCQGSCALVAATLACEVEALWQSTNGNAKHSKSNYTMSSEGKNFKNSKYLQTSPESPLSVRT